MRTHPAVEVAHGDLRAEVDVGLAPLVLEIWRAGIGTIHSCQDVGENVAGLARRLPHLEEVVRRQTGRASIGFGHPELLLRFYDALANAGPRNDFYERMVHWASPGAWEALAGIHDTGLEEATGPPAADGTPLTRFTAPSFQARFPRTDVDEMVERMRRHNAGEAVALGRPTWAAITVEEDGEDAAGSQPDG